MSELRSPLGRYAALGHEPDYIDARAAARCACRDHDIVCINLSWVTSWVDRQELIILADRIHGKRGKLA